MTDWQHHYEVGETPWAKGLPHPHLTSLPPDTLTGSWLIPGCGYGHDAPELVRAGAEQVIGIDIAPLAVSQAKALWARNSHIAIALGDLFQMESSGRAGTFDGAWEHTCFCAIHPSLRPGYVRSVAAALRPGGLLMACFYLLPWDPDEDQSQGPPFGTTLAELDHLFGGDFILENEFAPTATFPGRAGREWIRHLRRREKTIAGSVHPHYETS